MQLKSNYWKVSGNDDSTPADNQYYLPCNTALAKCRSTIAVSSNTHSENLKIYELTSSKTLVHSSSISLADIQCLQFLLPVDDDTTTDFRFLATGHSDGIAHLSTVPTSTQSSLESAEIIKRFNHRRFLKDYAFGCSPILNTGKHASVISSIELSPASWTSSALNSLITVYNHNVFLWDSCRSRAPKSVLSTVGVSNLCANPALDGVVGIVGEFGLSLLDFRSGELSPFTNYYSPASQLSNLASVSQSFQSKRLSSSSSSSISPRCSASSPTRSYCFSPLTNNNGLNSRLTGATNISWHENGYMLATANVSDYKDSVQIWDIRKLEPLAVLEGFQEEVVELKWLDNILWTADRDGYIYKWNINFVKTGANHSKNTDCCQSYHVSNSKIVGMEVSKDQAKYQVICLDSDYLGMHYDIENLKVREEVKTTNHHLEKTNNHSLSLDYSLKLQKDIDTMMSGLNCFVKDSNVYL